MACGLWQTSTDRIEDNVISRSAYIKLFNYGVFCYAGSFCL